MSIDSLYKSEYIYLCKMTKSLARRFFEGFVLDPILFTDAADHSPYEYSPERADAYFEKQLRLCREYLAIMVDDTPVGEIILKNFDLHSRCCTLSIHLQNNSVKDKGYGTQAEILALEYTFQELKMDTVYADAVMQNLRSQHVLEKVGFRLIREEGDFRYYACTKPNRDGMAF